MKRVIVAAIAMLAGAVLAFGAGGTESAAKGAPLAIRITTNWDGAQVQQKDNAAELLIEQYTNTKLDMEWVTGGVFENEILPVKVASGDLTDMVGFGGSIRLSYMLSAFADGVFWDITDMLKDYKYLSQLSPTTITNARIDGKLYGVPRSRPVARRAFPYRRDWAAKLGLKEPKTLDELYAYLKGVTEKDPDGNGQNDTYGMMYFEDVMFSTAFGAPNNWGVKDGKFVKAEDTPEFLDALKYLRKMYQEKIIHPEFAIKKRNDAVEAFAQGKVATLVYNTQGIAPTVNGLTKRNPSAEGWGFCLVAGSKGTFIPGERGFNGILAIPTKTVKDVNKVKGMLAFLDKLNDEKMSTLLYWGIEGRHYKVDNGKAVAIPEGRAEYDELVGYAYKSPLKALLPQENIMPGVFDPLTKLGLDLEQEVIKYAVADPAEPLNSKTWTEKGSQLTKVLTDAKTKYIMGQIDDAGWAEQVKKFRDTGGAQVAAEFAEAYAKIKK
jgi:putative aldouronate transport system substrate-binding protein